MACEKLQIQDRFSFIGKPAFCCSLIDDMNRLVGITTTQGTAKVLDTQWRYKYDKRNQLIGAVAKDGKSQLAVFRYKFDGIGNRLSCSTNVQRQTSSVKFDYNSLNQILNDPYKYDQFGNLISTADASYKYNLDNRLVEIKFKSSTTDKTDATDNKNNGTTTSSFQRQLKPRTHSPASIRSIRTIRG